MADRKEPDQDDNAHHDSDDDEQNDTNAFLQNLLSTIVMRQRVSADSNEDLVLALKKRGVITTSNVEHAMLTIPRGAFAPEEHQSDAYFDSPLRYKKLEFNISAPHVWNVFRMFKNRNGNVFFRCG